MAPVATLLALLVGLTSLEAKPLAPPGHHAPPLVANMLSKSKRALHRAMSRYQGESRDLSQAESLIQKRDSVTVPSGWSSVGCVSESSNQRLLQGLQLTSDRMDALFCLTMCQYSGFTYGATEYSDECYCGNSLVGDGGGAANNCTHPCSANSGEMCGGDWMMNLYKYGGTSNANNWVTSTVITVNAGAATAAPSATGTTSPGTTSPATTSPSTTSPTTANAATTSPGTTAVGTTTGPSSSQPTYVDHADSSEWYALGCAQDSYTRLLNGYSLQFQPAMTIDACLTTCEDKGYSFAGVEFGQECYCGSTVPTTITYSEGLCNMPCTGDQTETCGGDLALDLYELISSATGCPANATTSLGGNVALVTPSTTASSSTTTAAASITTTAAASTTTTQAGATATPVGSSNTNVPASSDTHNVWAHHMVGNTYPYGVSDWLNDINTAHAQGIDGFALNMGSDYWQPARVADAYTAAAQSGTGFKLFLSLDMTSLSCGNWGTLISLVQQFAGNSAQAMHNGKVLVSTFAGSDCGDWGSNFKTPLANAGVNIFFAPSFFSDPSGFSSLSYMDADFNWNSGWPMGGSDLTTASDQQHMGDIGSMEYMPAVSPFFFTHFGANSWNKNWLYRGDDWLYCTRWEQLIAMRQQVKMTEILTWNDYGESSYIGPIEGAMPGDASTWVNGFDHTALATLTQYYSTAFKTGSYPSITTDTLLMWSRPHNHDAQASNDPAGQPSGWQNTADYLWAVVLATNPATVTLTSGSNTQSFSVSAGLTKLQVPNSPGGISGTISRNGATVASANGGSFSYTTSPQLYNFNYIVVSS